MEIYAGEDEAGYWNDYFLGRDKLKRGYVCQVFKGRSISSTTRFVIKNTSKRKIKNRTIFTDIIVKSVTAVILGKLFYTCKTTYCSSIHTPCFFGLEGIIY